MKGYNLLTSVKNIDLSNEEEVQNVVLALFQRRNDVEWQEPNGDIDFFYDKWYEKLEDIESLLDDAKELYEEQDIEKKKEMVDKLYGNLLMHQLDYKGLKRIKIWLDWEEIMDEW